MVETRGPRTCDVTAVTVATGTDNFSCLDSRSCRRLRFSHVRSGSHRGVGRCRGGAGPDPGAAAGAAGGAAFGDQPCGGRRSAPAEGELPPQDARGARLGRAGRGAAQGQRHGAGAAGRRGLVRDLADGARRRRARPGEVTQTSCPRDGCSRSRPASSRRSALSSPGRHGRANRSPPSPSKGPCGSPRRPTGPRSPRS